MLDRREDRTTAVALKNTAIRKFKDLIIELKKGKRPLEYGKLKLWRQTTVTISSQPVNTENT